MDISKIEIESGTYNLKDTKSREDIVTNKKIVDESLITINNLIIQNKKETDNDITTVSNKVTNVSNEVTKVSNRVTVLENEKNYYLLIGDSYANGSGVGGVENSFATKLKNMLKADTSNFFIFAQGGVGFQHYGTTNPSYYDLLKQASDTLSSEIKNKITHVIVTGGRNDWGASETLITNGFNACTSIINSSFPNAIKILSIMGWDRSAIEKVKAMDTYYLYSNLCGSSGWVSQNYIYSVLQNTNRLVDDTHPTVAGHKDIALFMFNLLTYGNYVSTPLKNPISINKTVTGFIINNMLDVEIHLTGGTIGIPKTDIDTSGWREIGNLGATYSIFGSATNGDFQFLADTILTDSAGKTDSGRILYSIVQAKVGDKWLAKLYAQSITVRNNLFHNFTNIVSINLSSNIIKCNIFLV